MNFFFYFWRIVDNLAAGPSSSFVHVLKEISIWFLQEIVTIAVYFFRNIIENTFCALNHYFCNFQCGKHSTMHCNDILPFFKEKNMIAAKSLKVSILFDSKIHYPTMDSITNFRIFKLKFPFYIRILKVFKISSTRSNLLFATGIFLKE